MIFTLEALQADHGDSLLLHWNNGTDPRRLLIDGGPSAVWGHTLRDRLDQLRPTTNGHKDPLPLEMVMVSHIDEDHVGGLVYMGRKLKQDDADSLPLSLDIKDLWHNTFEDLLDDDGAPAALAAVAGVAASAASIDVAAHLPLRDSAALIASVNQGRELRDAARALAIPINRAFKGQLIQRPTRAAKPKQFAGGLAIEIIGPRRDRLDVLQEEWKKAKKKKAKLSPAQAAAFLDDSPFNLSSIIAIARANNKSMLLTGDARGDDILDGLSKARLLKNGKIHFDLFKVPHHGSVHNVRLDFLRDVTADHYVISANGRFTNPDIAMLEMLVAARGKDRYTIHLTNPVPHAVKKLKSLKSKGNFTVTVRDKTKPSLLVELGDKLPARLRP